MTKLEYSLRRILFPIREILWPLLAAGSVVLLRDRSILLGVLCGVGAIAVFFFARKSYRQWNKEWEFELWSKPTADLIWERVQAEMQKDRLQIHYPEISIILGAELVRSKMTLAQIELDFVIRLKRRMGKKYLTSDEFRQLVSMGLEQASEEAGGKFMAVMLFKMTKSIGDTMAHAYFCIRPTIDTSKHAWDVEKE